MLVTNTNIFHLFIISLHFLGVWSTNKVALASLFGFWGVCVCVCLFCWFVLYTFQDRSNSVPTVAKEGSWDIPSSSPRSINESPSLLPRLWLEWAQAVLPSGPTSRAGAAPGRYSTGGFGCSGTHPCSRNYSLVPPGKRQTAGWKLPPGGIQTRVCQSDAAAL